MISIADNLKNVRQTIKNAANSSARDPESVTLLAVSKTRPVEDLKEATNNGQRHFGENYLQDALAKIQAFENHPGIEWHFIGPIQSNKTRPIAESFQWVHTIDREKIARRLDEQRPESLPPLNICIQINIDDETSKSGISPKELPQLAATINRFENLQLRGIMAIPKAGQPEEQTRSSFRQMKTLYDQLKAQFPSVDTLSMGMSGDISLAIEEGSTLVRVGTAIFGERIKR